MILICTSGLSLGDCSSIVQNIWGLTFGHCCGIICTSGLSGYCSSIGFTLGFPRFVVVVLVCGIGLQIWFSRVIVGQHLTLGCIFGVYSGTVVQLVLELSSG